jgi:hypothetical protein
MSFFHRYMEIPPTFRNTHSLTILILVGMEPPSEVSAGFALGGALATCSKG